MNLAGYLCSPTDKDDIEYRPLRSTSPSGEDDAPPYTLCVPPKGRSRIWQLCTRWLRPWVAAVLGGLLVLLVARLSAIAAIG